MISQLAPPDPRWHWRNCRSLSLSLHVRVWPWRFSAERLDDYDGGRRSVSFGPITVGLDYGIGNISSENPIIAATGLSECEAWDRALRFEGWIA